MCAHREAARINVPHVASSLLLHLKKLSDVIITLSDFSGTCKFLAPSGKNFYKCICTPNSAHYECTSRFIQRNPQADP